VFVSKQDRETMGEKDKINQEEEQDREIERKKREERK
jgi:hypothetical protein